MYHPAVRISNRKTSAVRYVMNQNDNETKAKIILHERERERHEKVETYHIMQDGGINFVKI